MNDEETPLPRTVEIFAEDLMSPRDALDALPEHHNALWHKSLTMHSDSALIDLRPPQDKTVLQRQLCPLPA